MLRYILCLSFFLILNKNSAVYCLQAVTTRAISCVPSSATTSGVTRGRPSRVWRRRAVHWARARARRRRRRAFRRVPASSRSAATTARRFWIASRCTSRRAISGQCSPNRRALRSRVLATPSSHASLLTLAAAHVSFRSAPRSVPILCDILFMTDSVLLQRYPQIWSNLLHMRYQNNPKSSRYPSKYLNNIRTLNFEIFNMIILFLDQIFDGFFGYGFLAHSLFLFNSAASSFSLPQSHFKLEQIILRCTFSHLLFFSDWKMK